MDGNPPVNPVGEVEISQRELQHGAVRFSNGDTPHRFEGAFRYQWLNWTAKESFPVAQTVLAELHYKGQGVQRYRKEALLLTQLAVKANYPRARLNLLQLNEESGQVDKQSAGAALESMMRAVVTVKHLDVEDGNGMPFRFHCLQR